MVILDEYFKIKQQIKKNQTNNKEKNHLYRNKISNLKINHGKYCVNFHKYLNLRIKGAFILY
jgi:sulfate adenylyltransferase subunit 1 (EFTu-like GTPase family)